MLGIRSVGKLLLGVLGAAFLGATMSAADAAPSRYESVEKVFRSYKGEIEYLARAVYFEARSEPLSGQFAVARVILNRVDSAYYPHTVCEVVFQNDHLRDACQFSFACDGITDIIAEPGAFEVARQISVDAFRCDSKCRISRGKLARSTHYHAYYVSPWWSAKLERTGKLGRHIFYYTATR